ncbi:MAG: hypothetical protein ABIA92_02625 [Patescibacteria group bacterium]
MEQTKPPLPENHGEYDAHLLYASGHGPSFEVLELQIREQLKGYRNPWIVPWHMRPKFSDSPYSIDDFVEDVRVKLQAAIKERLSTDTSTSLEVNEAERATTLLQYISHTIVQHACALHTEKITPEQMMTLIRRELKRVFPKQSGCYITETPAHPFWHRYRGENVTESNRGIIRYVTDKKPSVPDKKLALWLAGPNPNLTGPDGRIADILRESHPFLVECNDNMIVRYASDLRRRLLNYTKEHPDFDHEDRLWCANQIADEWFNIIPPRAQAQIGAYVDDWELPIPEVLAKHFTPEVMASREAFDDKRFVLEQTTIQTSLETGGDMEKAIDDLARIFGVWQEALMKFRLCLSDYPTLGLAFLASNAVTDDRDAFMRNI